MSDAPLRWGILSTALINVKLLRGAAGSAATEVVAVASRDGARGRAFADEHGIARAHGSYEALLADPDVEAVYVPLPNALHHPWTLKALAAGKHVLCEKPYSRRPEEVGEAFAAARRGGLVLSEAYMYRYHPQTVELARLVSGGAIGELRLIVSSFTWPCDAPGDIRLDPELDGGSLMDVGCYCVSAARLLAGEPLSVMAVARLAASGVDEQMAATLAFDGGVLCHFDSGFHLPDRSVLEVVGTTGTIHVSDPWHGVEAGLELVPQDGEPRRIAVAPANPYGLELDAFAAAVRGGGGVLLGEADALGQARTIAALYASADSGRSVLV